MNNNILFQLSLNNKLIVDLKTNNYWNTCADEFIRLASPTMYFRRTATCDVEFANKKIKEGELLSLESFSVEKYYKVVFKLLGIGLFFLSLALLSGLSLQTVFSSNLILKAIFTFLAWIIYLVVVVGIKYFNFPIKYATRSLFISMWAVLGAYYMNTYLVDS